MNSKINESPFYANLYNEYYNDYIEMGATPEQAAELAEFEFNKILTPKDPEELVFITRSAEAWAEDCYTD